MSKDKVAVAFEIVDHGVEHPSYFQGCGTAFTDYTEVGTGTGDTFTEALDDALEMLAQGGWNVDIVVPDEGADDGTTASGDDDGDGEMMDEFPQYYVSVRVREYDPEHDDPELLLAGTAIGRLDELATEIHNLVVGIERESEERDTTKDRVKLRRLTAERDYLEGFLKDNNVVIRPGWDQLKRGLAA